MGFWSFRLTSVTHRTEIRGVELPTERLYMTIIEYFIVSVSEMLVLTLYSVSMADLLQRKGAPLRHEIGCVRFGPIVNSKMPIENGESPISEGTSVTNDQTGNLAAVLSLDKESDEQGHVTKDQGRLWNAVLNENTHL